MTAASPDWDVDGRDWPNRGASRFVDAGGLRWHVQVMGEGPVLLLLHGTGAATHSWRDLAPILATRYTIVAPDLPGHGFTQLPRESLSLPYMAGAVRALLKTLDIAPEFASGHSAGAAILLRMSLDGAIKPRAIVSLNGALRPFPGAASVVFPALAKLLFLNPLAAPFLAWRAGDPRAVKRLIEGTGSSLDEAGLDYYARLLRTRRHIAATVGMMANWDLNPLDRDMPRLGIPLTLLSGGRDRAVPPQAAREVAVRVPDSKVVCVDPYGHLMHEEAPERIALLMREAMAA